MIWKSRTGAGINAMKGGVDLNGKRRFWQSSGISPGDGHEPWQNAVCATDGFSALDDLHPHRRSTWWRPLREAARVYRAIPGDGLCATDLPRESARHRGLSVGAGRQALPHGLPARDQTLDARRCQRDAGLAHPCRICPVPDRAGAQALPRRPLWPRRR